MPLARFRTFRHAPGLEIWSRMSSRGDGVLAHVMHGSAPRPGFLKVATPTSGIVRTIGTTRPLTREA